MLRLDRWCWKLALPAALALLPATAGAQVTQRLSMEQPSAFVFAGSDSRAFLGVGVSEINGERAKRLQLKEEYGVEVTRVDEDSPAEQAGLKAGDVILAYNGQRVEGTEQFIRLVRETPAGRTVKLTIVRAGTQQVVSATLGTRKNEFFGPDAGTFHVEVPDFNVVVPERMPDVPFAMMIWRGSILGIEAEGLGETQLAGYFGVKDGVLVRSVFKGTAAEKSGLKAGDVLLKVDKEAVTTPRGVTSAIRNLRKGGKATFPVVVMREHKEITLNVTIEDAQPPTPRPMGSPVRHQQL